MIKKAENPIGDKIRVNLHEPVAVGKELKDKRQNIPQFRLEA